MESIEQMIPHRPPFLFVDEIVAETDDTLTTRRTKSKSHRNLWSLHSAKNQLLRIQKQHYI